MPAQQGPAAFDLAPILDSLMVDADIRSAVASELEAMERSQRFDNVDELMQEARDLLLARLAPGGN